MWKRGLLFGQFSIFENVGCRQNCPPIWKVFIDTFQTLCLFNRKRVHFVYSLYNIKGWYFHSKLQALAHFSSNPTFSYMYVVRKMGVPTFKIISSNLAGWFKRGASEAAAGCLASVAAKLVKTALENLFSILARGNKSTAANLGLFFLLFMRQLKSNIFQYTCAWK